jgi:hypothetical protein
MPRAASARPSSPSVRALLGQDLAHHRVDGKGGVKDGVEPNDLAAGEQDVLGVGHPTDGRLVQADWSELH